MSSYVTRAERAGSIFFRVTGLIRSRQLQWRDRPLWYDVYVAHPPLSNPIWDVKLPKHDEPVRSIFYEEDLVRAKFYKKYRNAGIVNLSRPNDSLSQQFINEYMAAKEELSSRGFTPDQLFSLTEERLAAVGVDLSGRPRNVASPPKDSSNPPLTL